MMLMLILLGDLCNDDSCLTFLRHRVCYGDGVTRQHMSLKSEASQRTRPTKEAIPQRAAEELGEAAGASCSPGQGRFQWSTLERMEGAVVGDKEQCSAQ